MEQVSARGCPDKPSSPRAVIRGLLQWPFQRLLQRLQGLLSAQVVRPSILTRNLDFSPKSHLFTAFLLFFLPLHIPTDHGLGRRVREVGPAQAGDFRHFDLYGKFQKSTAGIQTRGSNRTRIGDLLVRGMQGCWCRWGSLARSPCGRWARRPTSRICSPTLYIFARLPYTFAHLPYTYLPGYPIHLPTYPIHLPTYPIYQVPPYRGDSLANVPTHFQPTLYICSVTLYISANLPYI
jgi:hypothetical protein